MARAESDTGKFMQGRRPQRRKPISPGRHSDLTPEISKKITDALRAGNHLSVAARYAGVGQATLHSWLARGRGEHPTRTASKLYTDFVNDVEEAQAAAEVAAVLHWRSAMPKDWHAAKDWLKVTQPERWDPDHDKLAQGPIAAVQINMGSSAQPQMTDMPLESLIEEHPGFLKAVIPLFDAVDAAFGEETSNQPPEAPKSAPDTALVVQNEPQGSYDAVFDAEEGSWRVISTESDTE